MNPKVDDFLSKETKWQKELKKLRTIALDCGLDEDYKWMHPCYTIQKKNVVIIHGFKNYCALNFFKGALLQDAHCLLIQQTENVQAGRQIRFTTLREIIDLEPILKAYLFEAIEVEKAGLQVEMKPLTAYTIAEEFQTKAQKNTAFKKAFEALTPGRQKAYHLYFSEAKQSKTREDRIDKYTERILNGKGLTDCTCGLSKRMPSCDGSHKQLQIKK